MMKKGKRALRNKNKSDSLDKKEESDSEMQIEDEPVKAKETAPKKGNAVTALGDFKLQSKVYLDRLDETYEQHVQAMRIQYKKMFLSVEKDILDLTLKQFERLKESFMQEQNAEQIEVADEAHSLAVPPQRQQTQSPNVTSSKRTRSSTKLDTKKPEHIEEKVEEDIVSTEPNKETVESEDDFDDAQSTEEPQSKKNIQPRHSELVLYTPHNIPPMNLISHNGPQFEDNPGSMFTGMPLLNLFIPVVNGTAVTVLPRPVQNVGVLPDISPSIMRGLKIIQSNISVLTRAWEKQQKRTPARKSITAGPSSRK